MDETKPDLAPAPFRTIARPDDPAPPARFIVRRDENEVVIENRRRLEVVPRILLGTMAAIGAVQALVSRSAPVTWLIYFGTLLGSAGLWTLWTFWGRTTLTLRGRECSLVHRAPFRTRRLQGPLDSLDVVGIAEINPPPEGYQLRDSSPTYGLHLSVGGSKTTVFRGVPRADLEWVISQVRGWKQPPP